MESLFRILSIHVHDVARTFRPCLCHIDCILVSAAWKKPAPRLPERATEAGCALPWCGRWDSNPHGFLHQNLNLACLPFHHARMYINQCITYRGGIDGENGYAREKHASSQPIYTRRQNRQAARRKARRGGKREADWTNREAGSIARAERESNENQAGDKFSPPIVKGTRGERRGRRVPPSRIGARHD